MARLDLTITSWRPLSQIWNLSVSATGVYRYLPWLIGSRAKLSTCRFPHPTRDTGAHAQYHLSLWTLLWEDEHGSFPIGYMLDSIYQELLKVPSEIRGVSADTKERTLHFTSLEQLSSESERTTQAAKLSSYWRDHQTFPIVSKGWRNELWPIYGRDGKTPLFSFERAAVGLLGAMRYGVHMTAYVRNTAPLRGSRHDYGIWVAKRSATKSSHPGMLDNTAAGGASTADGLDRFECMVREANEEASFTEELMRSRAKEVGTISYINITDERAGMAGLIYPEVQWVFDLELPQDGSVVPRPKDGEAEGFMLCSVEEVQEQLAQGLYKSNCAVISESWPSWTHSCVQWLTSVR